MQESAQTAKEARGFAQGLKDSLQTHDPWDRDVEFQRKNLRTLYLKLLLSHPFAKESKDVETHLWMQTSYHFISQYKTRISTLERKLSASTQPRQEHHSGSGPVELRKLVSRFRQFLAEEEKFYMQLLVRLRRSFDLHETQESLVNLEILPTDQESTINAAKADVSRNIFPAEGEAISCTAAQRESRLAIFAKFLICIGDITRYREKYNEMGGRPRAGHEDAPAGRRGRGGRRGGAPDVAPPRPRNYSRALNAYSHARLLVPDDGNASHQLAILSAYQNDTFGVVLHYYRALCVRQPFDMASANLSVVLKKALEDLWRARRGRKNEEQPKFSKVIDKFKESVVVLHGLWSLDADEFAVKASKQARKIISEFATMVADRALPDKLISEVVVLALSALWKLRLIRDGAITNDGKRGSIVESLMASHILDLYRVLLEVGSAQLAESPEVVQDEDDLALHITAIFRRTLPALRITSKWLRSNFSYIESFPVGATETVTDVLSEFWSAYIAFFNALREAFPPERLPVLKGPLEEDVEMSGFSPIKRFMFDPPAPTEDGLAPGQSQVHPNEEQLMRIADLLADATIISGIENSPVVFHDGHFAERLSVPAIVEASPIVSPPADTLAQIMESHPDPPRIRDSDDDNATQTSRTDDDPVRDAFRTALEPQDSEVEEDDQEDEIVWNPRASTSPLPHPIQPPDSVSPTATRRPSMNNSPPGARTPQTPRGTTAQDLLKDVLGLPRTSNELPRHTGSSAPQASFLFGSGSPSARTTSIWTNTENRSFPTSKIGTQCSPRLPLIQPLPGQLHGQGHVRSQSQGFSSTWNSSYGMSSQNSQQALPGSPPSLPFAPSPLTMNMNVGANQLYHHSGLPLNNAIPPQPFGYHHYPQPLGNGLGLQQPVMGHSLNNGYQPPYHYGREGEMNQPFNNVYVPPVQRAWGHT